MLTSASAPVRVSRASVRRVPSTKATRRERSALVDPVRHERPAVLDQLAREGVRGVVRRLEAGPVGGVEGDSLAGETIEVLKAAPSRGARHPWSPARPFTTPPHSPVLEAHVTPYLALHERCSLEVVAHESLHCRLRVSS